MKKMKVKECGWWTSYIYMKQQWNLLQVLEVGRHSGGDLTNVQYKPIWDHHNESPLEKESIIIKKN
jgi:hypothetical protein